MTISIDKMPKKGFVLACFKDKTVFAPYEVRGEELLFEGKELFDTETPDECHFFDSDKEYRLVKREARGDFIERLLSKDEEAEMPADLLFAEDVLVKREYAGIPGLQGKIRVINRYRYSENDTLVLKDYRIAAVGR